MVSRSLHTVPSFLPISYLICYERMQTQSLTEHILDDVRSCERCDKYGHMCCNSGARPFARSSTFHASHIGLSSMSQRPGSLFMWSFSRKRVRRAVLPTWTAPRRW